MGSSLMDCEHRLRQRRRGADLENCISDDGKNEINEILNKYHCQLITNTCGQDAQQMWKYIVLLTSAAQLTLRRVTP